jgi:hypothetical protein
MRALAQRSSGSGSGSVVSSLVLFVGLSAGALGACGGGSSGTPSGTAGQGVGGSAGGTTGGGGSTTSAGGTPGAGGTSATGGTTGSGGVTATGGTTGATGGTTGATGGTTGAGGAIGAGKTMAVAAIQQTNGDGWKGTATFTQDAMGIITMTMMVSPCNAGAHAFHLDMEALCGNDAMDAGPHWSPKGEMLGEMTCAGGGGGMGMATFKTPSKGYWTIATGDAASDITMHALVIDAGPETKPGNRMACGVPRADGI